MARTAVSKLFWAWPKSEFGEHLATEFIFNTSDLLFSHVPTLQTDKQCGNVENTVYNSGLDRLGASLFWPFATLVWVSTHTLETTRLDKLTNRRVNFGDTYFVTLEQSRGDDRLWLPFRKCPTFFTLCVEWVKHMQVCLENMGNLRYGLYHICKLYC